MHDEIEASAARVSAWVERNGYRAYDPGDGQMSFLRGLTFDSMLLERILTASVLRTPFNIRPLLGIRPHTSTKGMGYMAWGYLWRYRLTRKQEDADKAFACLDWLTQHRAPGYKDFCWGNEFTFTTRAGRIPAHEPTIVWSGLIGSAFVDAYREFGNPEHLRVASGVCDWILGLPREQTDTGACLSYVAFKQSSIHNSNMLGAALLAQVGALANRRDAQDVAREAMLYSCARQKDDGSWLYGEDPRFGWIDSFHTGYNLDSLKRYVDNAGDDRFAAQLAKGYAFFRRSFFERDGRVRYMHDRLMPLDIQCAAQAIDTLALFSCTDATSLDLATRVADWTIANMQSPQGSFYYRDLGWKKIKTPMLHWAQGTMFKALTHLLYEKRHAASPARAAA